MLARSRLGYRLLSGYYVAAAVALGAVAWFDRGLASWVALAGVAAGCALLTAVSAANRRARRPLRAAWPDVERQVRGAADIITWQTGTARLLPRLLDGRTTGPVFLTGRRARLPLAAADLSPGTGHARLSYRRAAEIFTEATGGATLHQLRHSALTRAAEDGANTSILLSYSGHTSVASLARYTRVSPKRCGTGSSNATPPPGAANQD